MAKSKKNVLPKRIAGLKIPKSLRKSETLRAIARNPLMVELATAAIVAAASAFATKDSETGKRAHSKARDFAGQFAGEATAILERFSKGDKARSPAARPN